MIMLMAAETMLFTTLLGGYIVLRGAGGAWPPAGLPRLPLAVTWINSAILFGSCVTMARAWRALMGHDAPAVRLRLLQTTVMGVAFLAIQGSEWLRLVAHGLTLQAGVYGATFYTLVGLHGLHVLGAVIWLVALALRCRADRFSLARLAPLDICALYWFYVCGLWAVLFPALYLM
jgi:heme/copper-type cytochrome/quinol oxidase subunit 3